MENFREIRDVFIDANAAIEVRNAPELATVVDRLLTDRQRAAQLGARARQVVDKNTGATERVLAYLQ
jgi:3-deoxy-D-manno-octulosonic-acid transferase